MNGSASRVTHDDSYDSDENDSVSNSVHIWVTDASALLSSNEMYRFLKSTSRLFLTAASQTWNAFLSSPLVMPLTLTSDALTNTHNVAAQVVGEHINFSHMYGVAGHIISSTARMACNFAENCFDLAAALWLSDDDSTSDGSFENNNNCSSSSLGSLIGETVGPCTDENVASMSTAFLRIHDLDVDIRETSSRSRASPISVKDVESKANATTKKDWLALHCEDDRLHLADVMDALAKTSLDYATGAAPLSPKFKAENGTDRVLRKIRMKPLSRTRILEREALVWSGRCRGRGYGSDVPLFKVTAIINMSPLDLTELLLDSDRVKTYNKWILYRTDDVIFQEGINTSGSLFGKGETKIVSSETKLPLTDKTLKLSTVMHAKPIVENSENGFLIVSRTVSKSHSAQTEGKRKIKNDILLALNLLKSVEGHPGKTEMTAISHVQASWAPKFLVTKIGVTGLVEFVQSLRDLCE